jgi:hypothetical protein
MTIDDDIETVITEKPRKLRPGWLWPTFRHPRQAMTQITAEIHGAWMLPLLILTVLILLATLVAGPLRATASANSSPTIPSDTASSSATLGGKGDTASSLPPDFQNWTPDQQQKYLESTSTSSGPLFTYVFPAVGELAKIWLGWFLFAGLLHLALTLTGSRASMTQILNLTAWALLPSGLRYIVQIIAMLATHSLITHPGLSGFAPSGARSLYQMLAAFLPLVDLYLFWALGLLVAGLHSLPGLSTAKVTSTILISGIIILCLLAMPAFISSKLSGISTSGFGMFGF